MNEPPGVKFSYVDQNDRALFLRTELVVFDEAGRILSVSFAMRRIAVDVVYQLL
jgi:hypothetical protein